MKHIVNYKLRAFYLIYVLLVTFIILANWKAYSENNVFDMSSGLYPFEGHPDILDLAFWLAVPVLAYWIVYFFRTPTPETKD